MPMSKLVQGLDTEGVLLMSRFRYAEEVDGRGELKEWPRHMWQRGVLKQWTEGMDLVHDFFFLFQHFMLGGLRLFCHEAIGKQECGFGRREFLNVLELSSNGTRPDFGLFDGVGHLIQFLLHGIQNLAILSPFRLDTRKEIPHFTCTLLNSQRAEAHLKTIQNRPKSRRPSNDYAVVALDSLNQASSTNRLCKQTLDWEIEDSKVRRIRRSEILLADVPSA